MRILPLLLASYTGSSSHKRLCGEEPGYEATLLLHQPGLLVHYKCMHYANALKHAIIKGLLLSAFLARCM